ncbi:MAG: DHH family phosphoesterase [Candidatus Hodarchaeota archaeon]
MIVSITHELDLDGLGSQAIIKRYFNQFKKNESEIILHYAHYTNFIEKIKEILRAKTLPDQLIISDIGFNDDFKKLFPLFKQYKEKFHKILWFDHHLVDKDNIEELKSVLDLYLNDQNRCSAEIIKDYYLPDDYIAKKIALYSRDTDFHMKKYSIASDLQSIIAYHRGHKADKIKKKIVDLMSKGVFENKWYNDHLIKIKKWESEQSNFALEHVKLLEIEGFGELVISFAKIGGGKLSSLLKDNYPDAKVFIGIDSRFNELTIHSNYVNCRELAKYFNGGGHKNRAGFRYENIIATENKINQGFIQAIKEKILKYRI